MENNHVKYSCEKKIIGPYQIESGEMMSKNPFVEFYRDEKKGIYFVRMFAIVPSPIVEIEIFAPEAKEDMETHIGSVKTRTIRIKWENEIQSNTSETFNLWSIKFEYTIKDMEEAKEKDDAIKVIYEYNEKDKKTGDIGPRLSRGTVTTTGTPPASES